MWPLVDMELNRAVINSHLQTKSRAEMKELCSWRFAVHKADMRAMARHSGNYSVHSGNCNHLYTVRMHAIYHRHTVQVARVQGEYLHQLMGGKHHQCRLQVRIKNHH